MMVSSVSRETTDLAMKAIRLGAIDYVEKPSLPNMAERCEEIRTKLKIAYKNKVNTKPGVAVMDREFEKQTQTHMKNVDEKIRIVFTQKDDLEKLKYIIKNQMGIQPPTLLLLQKEHTLPEKFMQEFHVNQLKNGTEVLLQNNVYVGNLDQCSANIISKHLYVFLIKLFFAL